MSKDLDVSVQRMCSITKKENRSRVNDSAGSGHSSDNAALVDEDANTISAVIHSHRRTFDDREYIGQAYESRRQKMQTSIEESERASTHRSSP